MEMQYREALAIHVTWECLQRRGGRKPSAEHEFTAFDFLATLPYVLRGVPVGEATVSDQILRKNLVTKGTWEILKNEFRKNGSVLRSGARGRLEISPKGGWWKNVVFLMRSA